ncbi:hypothetical protein V8C86DRAFT_2570952 [Haematococcus lacustris]
MSPSRVLERRSHHAGAGVWRMWPRASMSGTRQGGGVVSSPSPTMDSSMSTREGGGVKRKAGRVNSTSMACSGLMAGCPPLPSSSTSCTRQSSASASSNGTAAAPAMTATPLTPHSRSRKPMAPARCCRDTTSSRCSCCGTVHCAPRCTVSCTKSTNCLLLSPLTWPAVRDISSCISPSGSGSRDSVSLVAVCSSFRWLAPVKPEAREDACSSQGVCWCRSSQPRLPHSAQQCACADTSCCSCPCPSPLHTPSTQCCQAWEGAAPEQAMSQATAAKRSP